MVYRRGGWDASWEMGGGGMVNEQCPMSKRGGQWVVVREERGQEEGASERCCNSRSFAAPGTAALRMTTCELDGAWAIGHWALGIGHWALELLWALRHWTLVIRHGH